MKITIVGCNESDWEGIYLDGKVAYQNHSISAYDVLVALMGKTLESFCYKTVTDDYMRTRSHFSDTLDEMEFEDE